MKTTTICDFVAQMSQRSSTKPAIIYKKDNEWKKILWLEYFQEIKKIGIGLLSLGIQKGDRIAIMSNTRWEWAAADYGILSIHGITVPIYQTVSAEDLAYTLNNSEAKILIVENTNILKVFKQIQNNCPHIIKIICIDGKTEETISLDDLKQLGKNKEKELSSAFENLLNSTSLDQSATILYTSGTTGLPKGVLLTHRQIISEISDVFPYMGATSEDTSLSFLPYAHIMGRIEHWGHVYVGFTLAFAESLEKVKGNLAELHPTFLIAVPRIFEKIHTAIVANMNSNSMKSKIFKWALKIGLKTSEYKIKRESIPFSLMPELLLAKKLVFSKVKEVFGGKIRFCVSGGAPLSRDIALFFHACDILLLEGYGLTETTAAVCLNTPFDYRFGSVGKPLGDVQIKIAEDGEILVKSDKVMKEYYKAPESTTEVFTDGWFHTGDIGEILPSGDIKITDRKKDLIKTAGGKYVAPQRLECFLKMNPYISNVHIHGDQEKYIVALITLNKNNVITYAKENNLHYEDYAILTQHPSILELLRNGVAEANSHLASFESIKRFAVLPIDFSVETGELTPSLKTKRKFIDKKFKKQISALYS